MSTLFRPESLANKQLGQKGSAYLKIPRSYTVFLFFLVIITFAFFMLLVFSDYSRKESIQGVLVSSKGEVRIYATRRGIVNELQVHEQTDILDKTPLLTLISKTHLRDGTDFNEEQKKSIIKRLANIRSQVLIKKRIDSKDRIRRVNAIKEHQGVIWQNHNQVKVAKELLSLKHTQYQHALTMMEQGFLSQNDKNNSYQQLLMEKQKLEESKSLLIKRKNLLGKLEHELTLLPIQLEQELTLLEQQKEQLKIQLKQITMQSAEQVQSTVAGRVTAIQIHNGEQVEVGQLLMTILPKDSMLHAELYLPSRAAGFVKNKQEVLLRYDAYPFQRYGLFEGEIFEVNNVISTPLELQTSLLLTESTYRVRVKLASQTVNAFGQQLLLQPGMKLEADIILDTMSLLDWVMMPIYAVKGII